MNFTPRGNVGRVVIGLLTVAVVGLIASVNHLASVPPQIAPTQDTLAIQKSLRTNDFVPIAQAVALAPGPGLQTVRPDYYYQPVSSWYKNKHWWKRNAPIVGGAAGGALIGGLLGGGKGALIGGAAGGGGGYLYKRLKHHHYHHSPSQHTAHP